MKEQLVKQMNKLKNELVNKEKFDKRKQLEKNIRKREREQIASGKKPYFMKKSMLRREELKQVWRAGEKDVLNKYMSNDVEKFVKGQESPAMGRRGLKPLHGFESVKWA